MSKRAIRRHHVERLRRKGTKTRCRCRKHRKGRPRVGGGMCKCDARDRIYTWRKQERLLNLTVVQNGYDLDSDEISVLTNARTVDNGG